MKKLFCVLLTVLLTIGIFAGCASEKNGDVSSTTVSEDVAKEENGNVAVTSEDVSESIELVVYHRLTESGKQSGLAALGEAFTAQHPNITISLEYVSQEDYVNVLKQKIAGDNSPDIAVLRPAQEPELVRDGLYAALDTDIFPEEIEKSLIDSLSVDGVIYGAPLDVGGTGMYYNETLLEKVGLTIDDCKTADGLLDACAKLKDAGITPFASGYAASWVESLVFDHYFTTIVQQDYPGFTVDQMSGKTTFDDYGDIASDLNKVLTMLREYSLVDEAAYSMGPTEQYAQFGRGETAFMAQGTWAITEVLAAAEAAGCTDTFGFTAYSWTNDVDKNKVAANADDSFEILSGTKHYDEAVEFLKFCMSKEGAQIWAEHAGTVPARTDVPMALECELAESIKSTMETKAFFYESCGQLGGQFYNDYIDIWVEGRANGWSAEEIIQAWNEDFANILATK